MYDENFVAKIREANKSNPDKLLVFDCRSQLSAFANKAKGAGAEQIDYYEKCELEYLNIGNIHTMRDSLHKLFDLSTSTGVDPYHTLTARIENSMWLSHINTILDSAWRVVSAIVAEKCSVLVHCSDGWDRTAQVSSVAQLLLDPYSRTIIGFESLIEKEWVRTPPQLGSARVGSARVAPPLPPALTLRDQCCCSASLDTSLLIDAITAVLVSGTNTSARQCFCSSSTAPTSCFGNSPAPSSSRNSSSSRLWIMYASLSFVRSFVRSFAHSFVDSLAICLLP